jgi:hypothetical protein
MMPISITKRGHLRLAGLRAMNSLGFRTAGRQRDRWVSVILACFLLLTACGQAGKGKGKKIEDGDEPTGFVRSGTSQPPPSGGGLPGSGGIGAIPAKPLEDGDEAVVVDGLALRSSTLQSAGDLHFLLGENLLAEDASFTIHAGDALVHEGRIVTGGPASLVVAAWPLVAAKTLAPGDVTFTLTIDGESPSEATVDAKLADVEWLAPATLLPAEDAAHSAIGQLGDATALAELLSL